MNPDPVLEPHTRNASRETEAIHLFHHSLRRGGGMERYALTLAASLRALGRPVVFHARLAEPDVAARLGVEVELLPVRRFPRKLQDFRFFRRVDRVRRQVQGLQIALTRVRAVDLVICGGTHRGYLARARKLAGVFDWLQIWMERQAYASARCVVSHSNLCTEDLVRRYGLPPAKISTLYPPVEAGFSPARDVAERDGCRRRLGLPADKVVLLFPSMGHSRKGLRPICRALCDLDEPFVLAVAGKPADTAAYPFVQSLGYLQDMATAYRAADFSMLGSYYEPFGLVGPESILCGTRLVFEENVGCLAAIKPEFVFRFSVWNAESIRRAVTQAVRLAQSGRHRVEQPLEALRYDPSPDRHAAELLRCAAVKPAAA